MAEKQRNPTPEEILQRSLEIRRAWSARTELRRRALPDLPPSPGSVRRVYILETNRDGTLYFRPGPAGG